jgi:hypothetical protein
MTPTARHLLPVAARGTLRRRAACALAALLWCALPAPAAERVTIERVALSAEPDPDPGIFLNAQFDFELPPVLAEAVTKGMALYFVVDFQLWHRRWYWFDQMLADETLNYRLTYSPLTRQYRLARGSLALPYDTLDEALGTVRRIGGWKVLDRGALQPGVTYDARVRLRLDTALLPKPFQVDALTNRDWSLASVWHPVEVGPDLAH